MEIRVDPKLFHDFYFKIAMQMRLPLTSRKVLEEFVDIDVNAEAVAKIISRNQYFEAMLMHEIKALGLKDNVPSLKAAIVLLGMQGTRNFVCALQVLRMVGRKHLKPDKDGKLGFKAADHLKYALKSEEFANLRRMQYADTAYAAGMMYDILEAIGREVFEADKTFGEYLAEVYKHGLKSARIGVELVKSFKNFGYSKFVFGACLIHDIGKLAMELLYPANTTLSYRAFRDELQKKPVTRDIAYFIEGKRFGLTHDYYSSQMAYYFEVFRGIERAVLFHHDPHIIRTANKELYSLASLIALASNMANNFRIPKDVNDPIFKAWITPELRDFKIDPKLLMVTMSKLGHETFG